MKITVFGAGRPDEETKALAYELGKRIAQKGHTLVNGGNMGTMEASAKGCQEYNGKSIGFCVKGTKIPWLEEPNEFLTEVVYFDVYNERVEALMQSDEIIVLPGAVGTLEELFTAWVKAIVHEEKPIYLIGEKNRKLLQFLEENNFINDNQRPFTKFVETFDDIPFL